MSDLAHTFYRYHSKSPQASLIADNIERQANNQPLEGIQKHQFEMAVLKGEQHARFRGLEVKAEAPNKKAKSKSKAQKKKAPA